MRFVKGVVVVLCAACVGAVAGCGLAAACAMPFSSAPEDILPGLIALVFGAPVGALATTVAAIVWLRHRSKAGAGGTRAHTRWSVGTWLGMAVGLLLGGYYAFGMVEGRITGEEEKWLFVVVTGFCVALGGAIGTAIWHVFRR